MLMDAGLDTGDMLDFIYTPCESKMSSELFSELGELGGELIVKVLKNFENLKPQNQEQIQKSKEEKPLLRDEKPKKPEKLILSNSIYTSYYTTLPCPNRSVKRDK